MGGERQAGERLTIVRLDADLVEVTEQERAILNEAGADIVEVSHDVVRAGGPDLQALLRKCDALMVNASKVRTHMVQALERCRIISRIGTGVDNIDVEAATAAGIFVTNVPDFCTYEMAEHTMAMLLALARRLHEFDRACREGRWRVRSTMEMRRVAGRTLGLIGFGRVARAVAVRARSFGLDVKAYHYRYQPGEIVDGVEMLALDELLSRCDFVSLHTPLTPATRHMIGERELRLMRPDAYLINTSRGAVVDEDALVKALHNGWIAGAAVDVYEGVDVFFGEERAPEHPLFSAPNVIFTPHVAANSVEGAAIVREKAARHVVQALSGRWPDNVINPGVLPRAGAHVADA